MKKFNLGILLAAVLVLSSCKNENKSAEDQIQDTVDQTEMDTTTDEANAPETIVVELESKSGSDVTGQAVFTEENGKVTMTATIKGLSEGKHAIHLHENADCSAEDASSAGGHWNPTFEDHGKWGTEEFHRGDIGNFEVNAEGVGKIVFTTDLWCIGCDDEDKNILGTAVIVHEGVDDYTSQPSGAAGSRVACGGTVEM